MQDRNQDNDTAAEPTLDIGSTSLTASLLRRTPLLTLHHLISTRQLTSHALTNASLGLIASTNSTYHHTIDVSPSALTSAAALDTEVQSGSRSALHGISILVKDNIPTLDGTHTTCGSMALVGAVPSEEAEVVGALRAAGAVVVGKGNMAEWAGFRSTSGCSGWSARGGQTTGLFWPGMKASGSSGGCAVAVGLGIVGAALGTETCYSIVSPAEKSGIIGFKPTRSLLSSKGLIHASKRLDTVGVLTRTVADTQLVLESILQHSHHMYESTKQALLHDLHAAISAPSLHGIRIAVPCGLGELQHLPSCKNLAFEDVLESLQHAGATITRNMPMPGANAWALLPEEEKSILLYTDMKASINAYLTSLTKNPFNITNLASLIAFTKHHPDEQYPARNVEGLENAQATDPKAALYSKMLQREDYFTTGKGSILAALTACSAHVMIVPTLSPTLQTLAVKAGSPAMSVPIGTFPVDTKVETNPQTGLVGTAPGIPFSAYIFGRGGKDEDVLRVGYVVERATRIQESLVPYLEAGC